jgi:ribosome maturation factor RimP
MVRCACLGSRATRGGVPGGGYRGVRLARSDVDIQRVEAVCRPVVEAAGFDLILAEWASDQGRRVLRLFLDHESVAVTLEDCATVSRRVSHVLDVEDVIPVRYALEVSTPGLDRPLVREKDFRRFLGSQARVTLKAPLPSGRKRLLGTLTAVEDGRITLEVEGQPESVAIVEVAKANLVYEGEK